MTYHKYKSLASCRRRWMGSAASWDPSLLRVDSPRSATPTSIASCPDFFLSLYLMVNLSSAISGGREYFSEPPLDLPTAQENPTSRSGYSIRPKWDTDLKIDYDLLARSSATLTTLESDYSSIELRALTMSLSSSSSDASLVDMKVSSLGLFTGPTNRVRLR